MPHIFEDITIIVIINQSKVKKNKLTSCEGRKKCLESLINEGESRYIECDGTVGDEEELEVQVDL